MGWVTYLCVGDCLWQLPFDLARSVSVLLAVSSVLTLVTAQQPPPNYSYDALPDTSFSCEGRVVGGYYADVEAGCQMFHVCGTSQVAARGHRGRTRRGQHLSLRAGHRPRTDRPGLTTAEE